VSVSKWITSLVIGFVSVGTVAAADNYTVDPNHTYPSLEFSHMGLSIWRGKFNRTSGKVTLDRVARTGRVEIQVDTASIDFGLDSMYEHASGADWLDVGKYPTMTFTGAVRFEGDVPASADGQLTLRGVTRPLKLKINSFNCIDHPFYKKEVCGADAEGELNRADFGMTKYAEGEAGKVRLRIQVEAIKEG
jgi:polyisoprenoid-binding protein YceI